MFNFGGTATVLNSTFSGNTAAGGEGNATAIGEGRGGAILNVDGSLTLINDTFAGDKIFGGTSEGGEVSNLSLSMTLYGFTPDPVATLVIANTILANSNDDAELSSQQIDGTATVNATGPNIDPAIPNILSGTFTGTAFTTANPMLGPLTYNFGPTQTMMPSSGSPAIDAGSNTASDNIDLTTDQRSAPFVRVWNGIVDLGAVEVQPIPPSPPNFFTLPPVPPLPNPNLSPLAVSGPLDGTSQLFQPESNGFYSFTPSATLQPFGPLTADVRVAVGDVDGDGTPDFIFATGPGVPFRVAVVSGVDNKTLLVQAFAPFEPGFTGGGFVATGQFDASGRSDFVVSPDIGGGPRVTIYSLGLGGTATSLANFFGIDDPNFRGGARTAVGDVNGDGTSDLIVAAGYGGGPRVTIFNGSTLFGGNPNAIANFFAFPDDAKTLRNGVYVGSGDVNADGFADLIFGAGPGGGPRVLILSGSLVTAGNIAGAESAPLANFFAGSTFARGGIRVAAINADGDEFADLAVGSGIGDNGNVNVYLGTSLIAGGTLPNSGPTVFGGLPQVDGVYVG